MIQYNNTTDERRKMSDGSRPVDFHPVLSRKAKNKYINVDLSSHVYTAFSSADYIFELRPNIPVDRNKINFTTFSRAIHYGTYLFQHLNIS